MKYKYSLFIVVFLFVLLREPFLCLITNINKLLIDSSLCQEMIDNQEKYINASSAKDLVDLIIKEF